MSSKKIPQRPYLLRAMHEWMTDQGQTPHVVVDASLEGVDVPRQHVQDGKIILNISCSATNNLTLENERICFDARFSGATRHVELPVRAVLGIYAKESGQGMIFSEDEFAARPDRPSPTAAIKPSKSGRAHLKLIK
jgi:stringent starvation protein B